MDLTGIRVLLVDDEPDTRELLAFMLNEYGAEAMAVASAGEVLAVSEARRAAIAITAYARVEDEQQAISAGFQGHISKPVAPGRLIAAISDLLG